MKETREHFFAVTAPGLEAVCAAELNALGLDGVRCVSGGAEFCGGLRDLYRANLWLRTASRVVVRVGEFRCSDFPELYRRTVRLPWGRFIRPGTRVTVRSASHSSRLIHSGRLSSTVAEAIERALGTPAAEGPEQLVLVRLEDDVCRLSVDSSGDLLHRRGYRLHAGPAPLRETLAAGVLKLLDWDGSVPLVDPMCGSGTIVIEGALMSLGRPPGAVRTFSFMGWPGWRPGVWQILLQEPDQSAPAVSPLISGSDRDGASLAAARRNAEKAGVAMVLDLQERDLAELRPPGRSGLLVCNPPYGGRISGGEDLRPLFRTLGEVCCRFQGWQVAFLCPDDRLARATGLPLQLVARLNNGGIPVSLHSARL